VSLDISASSSCDKKKLGIDPDLGKGYIVKKGLAIFPSIAWMSLTKLSLAGNNLPSPSPRRVW